METLQRAKIKRFRDTVWENRKKLAEAGFDYNLIYSWAKTDRMPTYKNAQRIAIVIGIQITDIPIFSVTRG